MQSRRKTCDWEKIVDGVFRSLGLPCAYALVDGDAALWIGAPRGADLEGLRSFGAKRLDRVLLTHHHRDTSALAPKLAAAGISVCAADASAPWLTCEGVRSYWEVAMPELIPGHRPGLLDRSFGVFDYMVHPVGSDQIETSLQEGQELTWRGWTLCVTQTPGHSRDHVSFVVRRRRNGGVGGAPLLFCGDALVGVGKLWSPYTTDWHHCFNDGLDASADSLRKLAAVEASLICPEHGAIIAEDPTSALLQTADVVERVAFLKSYERYCNARLDDTPEYRFLARTDLKP